MPPNKMSSRERMLAALNCQHPDHVPCSFMIYGGLKGRCKTYVEFIERQIKMGLDTFVELPPRPPVVVNDHYNLHGLPVSYDPTVTIKEWIEEQPGETDPIMVKEYHTPAGMLRAEVRQTDDWRWDDHVPFLDDYLSPRSKKFIVTKLEDLDALRYLLVPPAKNEIDAFKNESEPILDLARRHHLLTTGGWGVGADMFGWIYGLQAMMYTVYDNPELVREILNIVAEWNQQRMAVVLDAGIDLYVKRAWYENCDFWTPATYREFLYPILKADADLAHASGARFGYIITSNVMPLLEIFVEAGVDVLIGVDPAAWDLNQTKKKLDGKVCLWGGVNGHLTVEQGQPEEVQAEVRTAMKTLAPGGGFILSPVDNVRQDTDRARQNTQALVDEWQQLTKA
jgi:uroporphyrinogen-III decarboxylase